MAQWLLTQILAAIGILSRRLTRRSRQFLGRRIGDLLMLLSAKRRRITRENIAGALPQASPAEQARIARDSYRNLGITLVELTAFPALSDTELDELIQFNNIELIEAACTAGRGVILLSAHFGNWELSAYGVSRLIGRPLNVIVKHQRNPYADRLLNRIRAERGNVLIPMDRAAREAVRVFRGGGVLALLADQSARPGSDPFLDVFGRPAPVYRAPAALALRFGVPIVMGLCTRRDDGRYVVDLQTIDTDGLTNDEAGILELTRRHVAVMEAHIRKYPGQWVWQHRRWKHKVPAAAPSRTVS